VGICAGVGWAVPQAVNRTAATKVKTSNRRILSSLPGLADDIIPQIYKIYIRNIYIICG
jgi:hypothetical protein